MLNPRKDTSVKQPALSWTVPSAKRGRKEGRSSSHTSPTVGSWSPSPTMRMQSAWRMQRWVQGVRVLSAWYSTILWMSSCWPSQLVSLYSWMLGTDKENGEFNWFYITAPKRTEGNLTRGESCIFCSARICSQLLLALFLQDLHHQTDTPRQEDAVMPHFSNASLSMSTPGAIQLFQFHKQESNSGKNPPNICTKYS